MENKMIMCTTSELVEIITTAVALALTKVPERKDISSAHVYGLDGLAKLLNCTHPTAQRIKDSGKIPFSQIGRKLVFDSEAVLAALQKTNSINEEELRNIAEQTRKEKER